MFSYIKGIIAEKGQNHIVTDVGGVGFKIYTSLTSLTDPVVNVGNEATFHTYMYIKEGIMDLYGFSTKAELSMFELLISVNGVGAKGALAVLSLASPEKIAVSIVSDDASFIKKASGIGAKTAQRICLELKDKVSNDDIVPKSVLSDDEANAMPHLSVESDAIDALVSLGYSRGESQKAVDEVKKNVTDTETLIKLALRKLF